MSEDESENGKRRKEENKCKGDNMQRSENVMRPKSVLSRSSFDLNTFVAPQAGKVCGYERGESSNVGGLRGAELPQRSPNSFSLRSRWAETLSHPSAEEIRSCGSDIGSVHSVVCFLHRRRLSVRPPRPCRTSEEHVVQSVRLYRSTDTWPVDQRTRQICCRTECPDFLFLFYGNLLLFMCKIWRLYLNFSDSDYFTKKLHFVNWLFIHDARFFYG